MLDRNCDTDVHGIREGLDRLGQLSHRRDLACANGVVPVVADEIKRVDGVVVLYFPGMINMPRNVQVTELVLSNITLRNRDDYPRRRIEDAQRFFQFAHFHFRSSYRHLVVDDQSHSATSRPAR